jgi:hypothetical protein
MGPFHGLLENRALACAASLAVTAVVLLYLFQEFVSPALAAPRKNLDTVDLGGDPAKGTKISLPSKDAFEKPLPKKATLIIAMGDCEGCSAKRIDIRELRSLGWPCICFVIEGSPKAVASNEAARRLAETGHLIADTSHDLSEQLNVLWTPRWYVADTNLALIDIQREHGENFPKFADFNSLRKASR